jgi:transcriptional regulator with XRE-family HTH domain
MFDVRAIRKMLNLTQVELGDALGLNQSSISRLETGEAPLDQRTRLALEALMARQGISLDAHSGANSGAKAGLSPEKSAEIFPCTACGRIGDEIESCALVGCAYVAGVAA